MKRSLVLGIAAGGAAAIAFSAWLRPDVRLVYNPSASAPRGWYRVRPLDRPPVPGDLVIAAAPSWARRLADQRRYVPDSVPLLKPVAATSGARICRLNESILINGQHKAMARKRDRAGRPMPVWQDCRRLGEHEVFLLAAAPASFDGRYFGPITTTQLRGLARPLWTW